MSVLEIGQEEWTNQKFLCRNKNRSRIGKLGLDLFPIKPIIGRNTLSQHEFILQPLPYCHRYCGPYYQGPVSG
jgi:hypothetical protein